MGAHRSPGAVVDEVQVRLGAARLIQAEIKRLELARLQLEHDANTLAVNELGIEHSAMIVQLATDTLGNPANQPRIERLVAEIMSAGAVTLPAPAGGAAIAPEVEEQPAPEAPAKGRSGRLRDGPQVSVRGFMVPSVDENTAIRLVDEAIRMAREGGPIDRYDGPKSAGRWQWRGPLYRAVYTAEVQKRVPQPQERPPAVRTSGPPAALGQRMAPETAVKPAEQPAAPSAQAPQEPPPRPPMRSPRPPQPAIVPAPPEPTVEAAPPDVWATDATSEPEIEMTYGDVSSQDSEPVEDYSTMLDPADIPAFLLDTGGAEEAQPPPVEDRWDRPFASGVAPSELLMQEHERQLQREPAPVAPPPPSANQAPTAVVEDIRRPPRRPAPGIVRHGGGMSTEISAEGQALLDKVRAAASGG